MIGSAAMGRVYRWGLRGRILTAMRLRIEIDRAACRGAGECATRAPASFALDGEARAILRKAPGDAEATLLRAARACPNFAISVHRAEKRLV